MAAILIRNAEVGECDMIASVLRQAFIEYEPLYTPGAFSATTPTSDQIRERWDEGPVWVAVQNGDIVGTVAVVPKSSGLYVRSMAVLPSVRGRGIACQLLKEVERFAIKNGHTKMHLNTTPFLYDAIRLYKGFGFQRSDNGPQDLLGTPLFTMVKLLKMDGEIK